MRSAAESLSLCARMLDRASPIMRKTYPDDPWRSAWVDNSRGACLLREGDKSGAALVRTSAPVVSRRWNAGSLYGAQVRQRLRAAAAH